MTMTMTKKVKKEKKMMNQRKTVVKDPPMKGSMARQLKIQTLRNRSHPKDPPAPELFGELHSGIPELGLELGLDPKENGSGAKLLTHGDDSDEDDEEEEEQAEE